MTDRPGHAVPMQLRAPIPPSLGEGLPGRPRHRGLSDATRPGQQPPPGREYRSGIAGEAVGLPQDPLCPRGLPRPRALQACLLICV